MPGSSAERELIVENKHNFPILIKIIPKKDMEQFLEIQEVMVYSNQTKNIVISAYVPSGTTYGKYNGSVLIVIRRTL